MKNSKFLKKSLALVLAIMMVFGAMIPAGASAAGPAPVFDTVALRADDVNIPLTLSGTSITGTISDARWKGVKSGDDFEFDYLITNVAASGLKITYGKTAETATNDLGTQGVSTALDVAVAYANLDDTTTSGQVKGAIKLANADGETIYNFVLTVTPPSTSTVIKEVKAFNQVSATVSGDVITVTMPYTATPNAAASSDGLNGFTLVTDGTEPDAKGEIAVKLEANGDVFGNGAASAILPTGDFWDNTNDPSTSLPKGAKSQSLTVLAEAGGTKVYKVNVVAPTALQNLRVTGAEEATVDEVNSVVTIVLPYDAAFKADGSLITELKLAPTFSTGHASTVTLVTDADGSGGGLAVSTVLRSGASADFFAALGVDDVDEARIEVKMSGTPTATRTYKLNLTTNPDNPGAVIADGFKAYSSTSTAKETGTVNETAKTLTVTLGSTANLGAVALELVVSAGAKISVPLQASGVTAKETGGSGISATSGTFLVPASGKITLEGVNATTSPVTILVQPADANKAPASYKLTVTKHVALSDVALKTFILKDGETSYTGTITNSSNASANKIEIAVPFSLTNAELTGMDVLLATAAPGTIVTYDIDNSDTAFSDGYVITGSGDVGATGVVPNIYGTGTTAKIKVAPEDTSITIKREYTVVFKRATPTTGKDLLTFGTTATVDVADDSTFRGTIDASKTPKTVNIEYPYGVYNKNLPVAMAAQKALFTVSPNAVAFYVDGTDVNLLASTVATEGDVTGTPGTTFDLTSIAPATVYVVSEELGFAVKADSDYSSGTISASDFQDVVNGDGDIAVTAGTSMKNDYTVTASSAAPRTGKTITAFSFVDANGRTIPATVNNSTFVITAEFPWSVATNQTALYPVFTASPGAAIYTDMNSSTFAPDGDALTSGGKKAVDGSIDPASAFMNVKTGWDAPEAVVTTQYTGESGSPSAADLMKIYSYDEAGAANQPYTFSFTVAEAKTGAQLTAFSLGGYAGAITDTATAKTVKVTVPLGTSKLVGGVPTVELKPAYTASEMSTVTLSVSGGGAVAIDTESNLSLPLEGTHVIKVVSEDGATSVDYTLTVAESTEFTDVSDSDWFHDVVYDAVSYGLIKGVGNDRFSPRTSVKRGDFATMIARMFMTDEEIAAYEGSAKFVDINGSRGYDNAVIFCADQGFVEGYTVDRTFRPERTISRNELAVIIARVMELDPVTNPTAKFADDSSIPNWAKGAVYACKEAGYLDGKPGNRYDPYGTTARSEACKVLVSMFEANPDTRFEGN